MAPRKKLRQREAQLAFEALSIEGSLISPEWLAKVAQLDAGHQAEADYRIPKGLNLRDEIGRYWRMAQAHWADFARAWAAGTAGKGVTEQFVTALLKDCFGFASLGPKEPVTKGERTYPLGHAALEGCVPVVIAAPRPPGDAEAARRSALDDLSPDLGDAGRRRSAFGLAQEFLNAEEDALWALACDGLTLRICRDNASLTRPAWIEADLDRIFREERYADFAALWLLVHESRFGAPGQLSSACHLEAWRNAGREEGTRAREFLRDGVEEALKALGRGFLVHPENKTLQAALHSGALTKDAYFQELLRLVYRLIFLLTAEERDLLHPPGVPDPVRVRYAQGYSVRRLRDRSVKRSAHDRFADLWEGLKIVLRGIGSGEPRLGLPALGGLFGAGQCPHLDAARLENRALLTAVFRLSWIKGDAGLARVNWRDMGPEELGSVYESLLELVPIIPADFSGFSFATGDETRGNARKTTGSYYTPDSLVQVLLDSALEPVVKEIIAKNPQDPVSALLQLTLVDPACGSGHFLLAAARRLAVHVARIRANGTPLAAEYRAALRQVVSRCLFGVDLNPMAVELCRVSLWMEAVEPGRPLSFLDSHVQRGNALLGATPELMKKGIPEAAFEPIEGDDKKTASLLKKRNREVSEKQGLFDTLWSKQAGAETDEVTRAVADLDAAPDADLAAVAGKEARWDELQASEAFRHQKFLADAWCAAFVWPKPELESASGGKMKKASPIVEAAPTNALWLQVQSGRGQPPDLTVRTVGELTGQYHFFHWHLAFPQVFARGGFDVVLGNPPWERIKVSEVEFFAPRDAAVADAPNASARKEQIAKLEDTNPQLWAEWRSAARVAEGQGQLLRATGRYPLCGKGDVNTYAVFAEHNRASLRPGGRAGFIVPTGIATDDSNKDFFAVVVASQQLRSLYDFQSGPGLFSRIGHARFKFALVTLGDGTGPAELVFFARHVSELRDEHRKFSLTVGDFALLNPNTRTCPVFRTRRDALLAKSIYQRIPVLLRSERDGVAESNPWGVRLGRMFDMSSDAGLFRTREALESKGWKPSGRALSNGVENYLPMFEGRFGHQFNHRYASQVADEVVELNDEALENPATSVEPQYWVRQADADNFLKRREGLCQTALLGFRRVARDTDERTCIATIFPWGPASYGWILSFGPGAREVAVLCAIYNSFALDYLLRGSLSQPSIPQGTFEQVPVLPPTALAAPAGWAPISTNSQWLLPRSLELTYTAWDLQPFAKDAGCDGPPFRWDPARRFLLRAELDAAFFHLYGISHADADYILDTFPIVKRNDEKAYGEYRTKRVILEIYDEMAEAIRTGKPYQTRLDPPPADPRVAHPAKPKP